MSPGGTSKIRTRHHLSISLSVWRTLDLVWQVRSMEIHGQLSVHQISWPSVGVSRSICCVKKDQREYLLINTLWCGSIVSGIYEHGLPLWCLGIRIGNSWWDINSERAPTILGQETADSTTTVWSQIKQEQLEAINMLAGWLAANKFDSCPDQLNLWGFWQIYVSRIE